MFGQAVGDSDNLGMGSLIIIISHVSKCVVKSAPHTVQIL